MKKILVILLSLLLLLPCPRLSVGEEAAAPIASRADLLAMGADPAGRYELTADIDMAGEDWTPLPFSGELNGNGHTIYNLTVRTPGPDTAITFDGNDKEYETVFGGLFSVMTGAKVTDLHLLNAVVSIETDRHCFLGGLAGYCADSLISGCTVTVRNRLTLTSVNAGVGGLVGFCAGSEIQNCAVDAELVFTDVNRDVLCEEFLGGIYACGYGKISGCTARTRGYAEVFGYAHSGGLIGMHKLPKKSGYHSSVTDTSADTEISFFEITRSRRAYCSPTIGEDVGHKCARKEMTATHYVRFESKQPVRLDPEGCEEPVYTEETTAPTCTEWGYTTHTCAQCDYSYRDDYTPPAHPFTEAREEPTCTEPGRITYTCPLCGFSYEEELPPADHTYSAETLAPTCTEPGQITYTCTRCGHAYSEELPLAGHISGDFVQVTDPGPGQEGLEQQLCQVCGAVLEERILPALPYVYAETLALSANSLQLSCGQTGRLRATVSPADASDSSVTFESSDEAVVQILPEGYWEAGRPGTACITCRSGDGHASAQCIVTVSYTPWQWVRHYLLFGWLWEK